MDATQAHRAAREGDLAQLQSLIAAGPGLLRATDEGSPYPTPLHWTAYRGRAAVVTLLVGRGADLGARDLARRQGRDEVVEALSH